MKLYNYLNENIINNKSTSVKDHVISGHLANVLFTINKLNEVKMSNSLIKGTGAYLGDYEIVSPLKQLLTPLKVGVFAGDQYVDYLDHEWHIISDIPDGAELLEPVEFRQAQKLIYNCMKSQHFESHITDVQRDYEAITSDNWTKYCFKQTDEIEENGEIRTVEVVFKNESTPEMPVMLKLQLTADEYGACLFNERSNMRAVAASIVSTIVEGSSQTRKAQSEPSK